MTFFLNGVDVNRDANKDDLYVILENVNTPAFRTGSGGAFTGDGARIEAPSAITAVVDGMWQSVADLSVVVESAGVTVNTADITIDNDGFYVFGADIDVTQDVLYDPELEYRVAVNATEKYLSEEIKVYEANVLQTEISKVGCYLSAGDVLTVEYKASLGALTIDYIGLYCYALSSGVGGAGSDLTTLNSRWSSNEENIAALKTLTNTDVSLQWLENTTGGNLNVDLPATPDTDKFFFVENRSSSTGTLTLDSAGLNIVLNAGDTAEVIYTGTAWRAL